MGLLHGFLAAIAAVTIIMGSGCAHVDAVEVRVLQDVPCVQVSRPYYLLIDNAQAYEKFVGAGSTRFVVSSLPPVDFEKFQLLVIGAGEKPTAGYGLAFVKAETDKGAQQLRVIVKLMRPAEGSLQAQVLTYPCLQLLVPRADYRNVEVSDGAGTVYIPLNRLPQHNFFTLFTQTLTTM